MKDAYNPLSTTEENLNSKDSQNATGVLAASELLKEELYQPQALAVWSRYLSANIATTDKPALSYRAISRAIAAAEFSTYGIENPPARYKDRVRRAILGERMTPETLQFFAETFSFSPKATETILQMITRPSSTELSSSKNLPTQFSTTSSLNDVYVNNAGKVERIRCHLIVCAQQDDCCFFLPPQGDDISSIEVNSGAQLFWSDELQQEIFKLDVALNNLVSGELDYTLYFSKTPEEDKNTLLTVNFSSPKPQVFYRFFFSEDADSPSSLQMHREFLFDENAEDYYSEIRIHNHRASAHLEIFGNERLTFSLPSSPALP